jgi:hypothetical protein
MYSKRRKMILVTPIMVVQLKGSYERVEGGGVNRSYPIFGSFSINCWTRKVDSLNMLLGEFT